MSETGKDLRDEWLLPPDVTYLNHGSFGPTPRPVIECREKWLRRAAAEPMRFFIREMERELASAAQRLADFVGADPKDLVFVDNATYGMNVVAASLDLSPGDEVLLSDHEYGAVTRIWRETCRRAEAQLVVQKLPAEFESTDSVVEALMSGVGARTRLIVVSHVTSPTAVILPVAGICRAAQARGVPVCIDGPHAVAMLPLKLRSLGCQFYTASCHKWLSAPLGTGFLYVDPAWQQKLRPPVVSWGKSVGGGPARWQDEFNWLGTRDPSGFLAVPAAIDFLKSCGIDRFRDEAHQLVRTARHAIEGLWGVRSVTPDSQEWFGTMATIALPERSVKRSAPNQPDPWQQQLWDEHRIEVPVMDWHGRSWIRVSCHLYNTPADVDRLLAALRSLRA